MKKIFVNVTLAANTAVLIAGPVLLFLFLGLWLDSFFKTSPLIAIVCGLLGFVGSILSLMKFLKTMK